MHAQTVLTYQMNFHTKMNEFLEMWKFRKLRHATHHAVCCWCIDKVLLFEIQIYWNGCLRVSKVGIYLHFALSLAINPNSSHYYSCWNRSVFSTVEGLNRLCFQVGPAMRKWKKSGKSCKLNSVLPPDGFLSRGAVGAWLENRTHTRNR